VGVVLQVTKALIDMENMFELLATEPRVQDEPHAATLQVSNGTVEFKQVWQGALVHTHHTFLFSARANRHF
jgi:ABC-type transport system involved in Fe-S cluster assembly fused permease/ATPase subunit